MIPSNNLGFGRMFFSSMGPLFIALTFHKHWAKVFF